MIYKVKYSKEFKKSIKKLKNDSTRIELIKSIIARLANNETLEAKYKDHKLKGEYDGFRECHIEPDLLLIYKKEEKDLLLLCLALGTHSKLF